MKWLKVLGFLALGVGVIAVGLFVLGLITSLLHLVVPLAIIAGVGWLVWNVFFAGKSAPKQDDAKKPEAAKQVDAPPERKALTTEEAARIFDEHKKNLQ